MENLLEGRSLNSKRNNTYNNMACELRLLLDEVFTPAPIDHQLSLWD